MEKIKFCFDESGDSVEFFVLEQTKINGASYILVTDSQEDDAECLILKEGESQDAKESVYEIVEDDVELQAVSKVFEELLAEHKGQHLAAEDIFELMKDEYPEMGLATVYRTLQLLYEIQLIDRIHFNDGCIRYEIGHIFDGDSKHSHHHLICRTCGRVMPFEDDFLEDLEAQIEADTGFHVLDHELKFYGQCKECAEASMRKENT